MSRVQLLFAGADEYTEIWQQAAAGNPGLDLVPYRPGLDPAGFRYLMMWRPVPGLVAAMPNLAAIFSFGAGVERLLANPEIPQQVPIVRMVEPGLTQGMAEYVLWQTLRHHRRIWELEAAQQEIRWAPHWYPAAWDRQVGILGLGTLGQAAAGHLRAFDFTLRGWSQSRKDVPGVTSFAGPAELPAFLDGLDILICLLPLTPATAGILNAGLFARLARGASLINAGRGGHLNEADLIPALESGQLAAASLDVFAVEPLPAAHPFWRHPRIFITPHNASDTDPRTGLAEVLRQIRAHDAGAPFEHVAERKRGY
ncbi:MAG: glyoxylate/hydroxypyruvate reductase A [Rhodospirillaceae bacterium]|nr:glyoxylate/hydroxypyruvate reductase A [Rhodospirillaceae bacterium]